MMNVLYTNLLYFLLFSVVAACLFWVTSRKYRSLTLLVLSLLFYTVCAGWYVVFVLLVGLWSFFCAGKIGSTEGLNERKKWLIWGIVPILVILCLFKYWTPTYSVLGRMISGAKRISLIKVVLPLGMSYYILKSISYIIDVYRERIHCERYLINYLAYISFYGQIVSGPIQRYEQWESEFHKERPTKTYIDGFYHVASGLFMKLVIANRLVDYVSATIAAPNSANGLQLWLGFFFYAIYIYCDFAGYSHIAIGVTNLFGLECIDNFNRPYFSKNIREFWNRWHISLSSWLKDYVYIPLGGNRKGSARRILNVMITFLICGIWHGSTLSFIIWGIYHGLANVLTSKSSPHDNVPILRLIKSVWTFLIVSIGWVFFATPNFGTAIPFFKGMFTRLSFNAVSIGQAILPFTHDNTCVSFFLTVVFFIVVLAFKEANDELGFIHPNRRLSFVWQVFVWASILLFGVFGANTFIYAGF